MWEYDPWGRAFAGLPTDNSGDFAWVQHMIASMAQATGRMAVVLPQGVLFRGGVEGQIRRKLLEQDLVEAVIGLAPTSSTAPAWRPASSCCAGARIPTAPGRP